MSLRIMWRPRAPRQGQILIREPSNVHYLRWVSPITIRSVRHNAPSTSSHPRLTPWIQLNIKKQQAMMGAAHPHASLRLESIYCTHAYSG